MLAWLGSCGSGAAFYDKDEPQNGVPDFNQDPVAAAALHAAAVEAFAACDSVRDFSAASDENFAVSDTDAFETGEFRVEGKFCALTTARYLRTSMSDPRAYSRFICEGVEIENGDFVTFS